jgi:4-amino-4-deoxy-L-arabinose transferase-like glycosyltransferase
MGRTGAATKILAAALVALALFMGFWNLGGWLMNDDEGTYLYDAWRVSLGETPYRDFFLSQTPLGIYLGSAAFKAFGPSVGAARALMVLFLLASAALVGFAARRYFSLPPVIALLSAAVFLFTKHVYFLGRTFMPDVPMVFFSAASLVFALKAETAPPIRKSSMSVFLFGIMAGLASLSKLNAAVLLAGYGLFLAYAAIRRFDRPAAALRKALLAAAGFLISFGLPFGIMLATVPGTFAGTIGFHLAKEKAAEPFISLVLSRLGTLLGNHNYGLIPVAVAGMVVLPFFKDRRRALAAALLLASLGPLLLPGTFYLRYVVFAFVPLALFFGDGLSAFAAARKPARLALFGLAGAVVLLTLAPSFSLAKLRAYDQGTRDLAAFIAANTAPGDFVFGDDPGINFLTRRPCPPRLVDVSGAMTRSGQVTAAMIREECEKAAVKFILVETEGPAHHLKNLRDYADFEAYLNDSFAFVRTARREFLGVAVWIRK